jgi:VanZ family protein
MHGLFYLPLGLAACLAARERGARRLPALLFGAAVSGVYGLGLEFVQAFLPWRSFEWMDAAFDLVGGGAGAGAATLAGILKTG